MRWFLSLVILATVSRGLADDMNWAAFGNAGNSAKSKDVQMQRETVSVKMDDKGVLVKATFWFVNHGGKKTVKMAFPDETSNANWDRELNRTTNIIRWFKSWVDGKPVAVKKVVLSKANRGYSCVWVKTVPFEKGQRRRVEVQYFADHGFAGNGWIFDTYILSTGATWAGAIEQGTVSLDWSKMKHYSKPEFGPGRGLHLREIDGSHAVVTFTHLKPKDEVNMEMVTGYFNFTMNGKPIPNGRGLPDLNGGPILSGSHGDLVIPVKNLPTFFARRVDSGNDPWKSPEAKRFGRSIEYLGDRRIKLGNGKTVMLRRAGWTKNEDSFVYLRDLIEALGGSYRYNAKFDRVDLRLP